MYAIEVQAVVKRFGARTVLDVFSCAVADGECIALCGPSGCGKTTLLRLIAGLDVPDGGVIFLQENGTYTGITTQDLPDGIVGMVFQDFGLWPHMRASRHIEFVLKNTDMTQQERREYAAILLASVGLEDLARAYPGELSGGEQQRLAFARAIATDPQVLLLDEPFSNLDPDSRSLLTDELNRRKESDGITIMIATHDPGEAIAVADRRIDLPMCYATR